MSCTCHTSAEPLSEQIRQVVEKAVLTHGRERRNIIPLLQALQKEFNYLPHEALTYLCEISDIERAQLISVSTFYSQFRHLPAGEHLIKVCTGTACHVKGAGNVYDAFLRELHITDGGNTSPDMRYSVEKIACLGCCTLAPVVQIDDKTYGYMVPGRVKEVLADFQETLQAGATTGGGAVAAQAMGEVRLGMGSCCMASGSEDIYHELLEASAQLGITIDIKPVGCVGVCNRVPLIDVVRPDGSVERYPNVRAKEVKEILQEHFRPSGIFRRMTNKLLWHIDRVHTDETWDNVVWKSNAERTGIIDRFLSSQRHISTEGYGVLAPLNIDEYMAHGGFEALRKVLAKGSPEEVVSEVLEAGIRGRGGGGFPTGRKWEAVRLAASAHKYVVCNGDEGDPGAFMDRMLLESYPFRVIEGMLIAAYAVGADKGVFYIRAEYPLAVTRVQRAVTISRERGFLGTAIAGSRFRFDIEIVEGAGAFVCGEETALIASIEGERGFPRLRPPFPAERGLFGLPTLVNNVETLSQIAYIVRHGATQYNAIGTTKSKGTKVFALAGKVRHGGLIEVPMGITLREIIEEIGGGVEKGRNLKAVQVGGPSGGCIPAALCDTPVDFDAFNQLGAMMGSGGLVVLDETDCMVDVARYFLTFTCEQSCGKCTFCRIGIRRMLDLLEKICRGEGEAQDLTRLEELALSVKEGSLCGLGKTAPNPVLTTLQYFRHEYEAHIRGECPTGVCTAMVDFVINERCNGCTKCAKVCPVNAIGYTPYEQHQIDTSACVWCGLCMDECQFGAIEKKPKKKL